MTTITAQMVKELRETTGAGVLDCKKALVEADGEFDKAIDLLREKGIAKAKKRAGRAASEGIIQTYQHHNGRFGVMVEVNCETDFVAATDAFLEFANDLALHIASMSPLYVSREDVPEAEIEKEKKILRQRYKEEGKPENILDKIVDGALNKYMQEVVLLEQPWIRDDKGKKTVEDMLMQVRTETKENVVIRRFARYVLGAESGEGEEA
jgi:elongation factor Ts